MGHRKNRTLIFRYQNISAESGVSCGCHGSANQGPAPVPAATRTRDPRGWAPPVNITTYDRPDLKPMFTGPRALLTARSQRANPVADASLSWPVDSVWD